MSFSLYDIRKKARAVQNYLVSDPQPELTVVRQATTTDPWGPTVKEMDQVKDLLINSEPEFVISLIANRIAEYVQSYGGATQSSYYSRAVHYLNMGSEWRIVFKCLKVLEYLVITADDTVVPVIGDHMSLLEEIGNYAVDESDVTTKGLQKKEHREILRKKRDELVRLLKDHEFRDSQRLIFMKLQSQEGIENGPIEPKKNFDDDVPGFMQDFKVKQMDRHKMANSNLKNEIRTEWSHMARPKEVLPGDYGVIGSGQAGESLFDEEELNDVQYTDSHQE